MPCSFRSAAGIGALLLLAVHVAASWVAVLHAWRNPLGNWDIIPYAALVRAPEGRDAAALSGEAYEDVRQYVGDAAFRNLLDDLGPDQSYRTAVYRDPAALADNLHFYSVKPLYILLSRLAYRVTGNAASAAGLVSAVSLGLLLSVLPFFFHQRAALVAALWVLLLTGDPPVRLIAACATPDTLAMLFTACCGLAAVQRRHWGVVALLALLAVLARPDAAFVVVPLLGMLGLLQWRESRPDALRLLGTSVVAFALFVWLGKQALPWTTLFWHTFMQREPFPTQLAYGFAITDYLAVLQRTAPNAWTFRPVLFLAGGLALAVLPWFKWRRILPEQLLALAACGGMVLHYLVFPIDEYGHERLFFGSYALLLGAAVLLAQRLAAARAARGRARAVRRPVLAPASKRQTTPQLPRFDAD